MDNDLYRKLVDLYAGHELPTELEAEMELAAQHDAPLAQDMISLRATVNALKTADDVAFTEESYQRILQKLIIRGAPVTPRSPEPAHLQYQLPIQG